MPSLHYLTVQDVLWINLQVTKKVHHYNYARLEEGTAYQYAYGESKSLVPQAARFLTGFLKMRPFETGNEATAFVGCAAFLKINGMTLDLTDDTAPGWFERLRGKPSSGAEALASVVKEDPEHHAMIKPDIRGAIKSVIDAFPCTVLELGRQPAAAG